MENDSPKASSYISLGWLKPELGRPTHATTMKKSSHENRRTKPKRETIRRATKMEEVTMTVEVTARTA